MLREQLQGLFVESHVLPPLVQKPDRNRKDADGIPCAAHLCLFLLQDYTFGCMIYDNAGCWNLHLRSPAFLLTRHSTAGAGICAE